MKISSVALVALGMAVGYVGGIATLAALAQQKMPIEPKRTSATADLGYSDCRFTASPDGQWYQKDQEHSSRYKAGCGTAGVSFYLNPAWSVGIHYVQLGRTNVEALAVAFPGDDRAQLVAGTNTTRAACNPSFGSGCLYQWHTGSFTRGVNFSTSFRMFEVEGVRFDAKVGAYFHKLSSTAVVEPLGCRDNCPWRITVDQSAQSVSPMWGAVVSWKWLYASWESYERIGAHTPVTANVKGSVEVKTIGVRIPL